MHNQETGTSDEVWEVGERYDDQSHIYYLLHNINNPQETKRFSRYWVMGHAFRLVIDGQLCYEVPTGSWYAEAWKNDYRTMWVLGMDGQNKAREVSLTLEEDDWSMDRPQFAGTYYIGKGACS